jgi:HSP20 family protein
MWGLIPWKKGNGGGAVSVADPLEREFSRIRNEFDSLLQRAWNDWPALGDDLSRFGLDVDETDTHYVARVTAPGFEVEDFDVQVSGSQLVVKAEHKEEHEGNGRSAYRFGRLQRSLTLPQGAETDQIDASYHAGILELKIPKGKEVQGKRVEVKAG